MQSSCYQIFPANHENDEAWDQYVNAHPDGTIFHSSGWQNVVEKTFRHRIHHLVARSDRKIVGVLPLFEIKSALFDHFLVSVPFAEVGGALADNLDIERSLVSQAIKISKARGVSYLELKNRLPVPGLTTKSLYYNFSRPIHPTTEENLLAIPRKSRAMVRKGINSGLKAEWGRHQLDEFYLLLARNYHRLGTPIFPKRLFREFLDEFSDHADLLLVRNLEGQSIAGVMTFFYQDRVMPYYAGSHAKFRDLAPNDFMYWNLMEYGRERGCKIFDFGRSKAETGSFSFKKNWGFDPQPLAYQYHVVKGDLLPNLSPANPKYRKKIEIWRQMPFLLTRVLGPPLAKYLA